MEITEPEDSEETVAKETSIFSPTSVTVVLTEWPSFGHGTIGHVANGHEILHTVQL
ncbi:hypothetical protein RF55_14247, partial [Lasius niger]